MTIVYNKKWQMLYVYNVKCKYIKVLISLLYPANRKTMGI